MILNNLNTLKIHKLTQEQYNAALAAGKLQDNEIYLTPVGITPIAEGGTGANTAADALINFGLTATATELNYCDGVTSNIQTQLDDKLSLSQGGSITKDTETDSTTTGAVTIAGGLGVAKSIRTTKVYGAVWNDYAEYRNTLEVKPGQCVAEVGNGDLYATQERLIPGCSIVSDTFGFAIGETDTANTPLAVSGRVLAYPDTDRYSFKAGDSVCSGPNGTVSKMTREEIREYPDCILGFVSEIPEYETWGSGNVPVNNRIWIKLR